MESDESRGARVEQKAPGAKGHDERFEDPFVGVLLGYLQTQARLDAALKAIRDVAEGRASVKTLKPFLSERPRLPLLEEITKKLRGGAEARTESN